MQAGLHQSVTHADLKATHLAARQMDGYLGGYQMKRQPVGTYELRQSSEHMPFMREKMLKQTPAHQWATIVNRVLSELEARGTMRTAQESMNLAINLYPHDVKNAEFLRTYRNADFPGNLFLARLEIERRALGSRRTERHISPCERS